MANVKSFLYCVIQREIETGLTWTFDRLYLTFEDAVNALVDEILLDYPECDGIKIKKVLMEDECLSTTTHYYQIETLAVPEIYKQEPEKDDFAAEPQHPMESTPAVVVSRADIDGLGYDSTYLDDDQFERFANKVGDILIDNIYWEAMRATLEAFGVPKTGAVDEDEDY